MAKSLKVPKMGKKSMVNLLLGIGAVVILVFLFNKYSMGKGMKKEPMAGNGSSRAAARKKYYQEASGGNGSVQPAAPGDNEQFATVANSTQGNTASQGIPPSCSSQPAMNPSDLLPNDENSSWSQLNPGGSGALQDVNLLSAGALIGIDTVGNTLRNANLQERSEPPNPQLNVGPWNNTTIAPDTMRVPLEIGCGSQ
jgi:hypothetical protein